MKKLSLPESVAGKPSQMAAECWFDDACILDMDYFVKTLSVIKAKGVSPDLIGSLITHYASKWLPELTGGAADSFHGSTESITALWMKKRFLVETLMGILPPEKDSIPCNFLLRLLRTANTVGVEPSHRAELEKRIAWQLDEASLKELMIPSFSHTCGTLLDVELVHRLVQRFVSIGEAARSSAATVKVAKLVDSYLAEAAVDSNLTLPEFVNLASALPSHARALDDGLYRAVDTYLKAHPGVTKDERKALCRLIDSSKLSPEASLHAAQNERLPLRAVIQVLIQANNAAAVAGVDDHYSPRCHSKRQVSAQQFEIKKLREDVIRLQSQVSTLQLQMERLMAEKKTKKGLFSWTRFGSAKSTNVSVVQEPDIAASGEVGFGRCLTPMDANTKVIKRGKTPPKWRTTSLS